jgi:hypothetical protein
MLRNKKCVLGILAFAVVGIIFFSGCVLPQEPEGEQKQGSKMGIEWFQTGNTLPISQLQPKQSKELENNYIGTDLLSYDPGYNNPDVVYPIGFKWMRISANIDPLNWQYVETEVGKYSIDPAVDDIITEYASNGINIVLNLGVGVGENRPDTTRFKTMSDVERYSNYVRFMVRHFKDRVRYYEIWNEPGCDCPWGEIAVEDYANLFNM